MINKVTLIGNIGNDPESKTFDNGTKAVSFSVATTERWKSKDGQKQERTEWHRIVAFGKLAEIIEQYAKKGQRVYIDGKIAYKSYEKDGQKKFITNIQANEFKILDKLENSGQSSEPQLNPQNDQDDLPF